MFWTPRQRGALAILATLLFILLLTRLLTNRARITDPQPSDGSQAARLSQRIDPNTASAADLAALPLIGNAMAQNIVDLRSQRQKVHPSQPAFSRLEDLLDVKGIGPTRLQQLEPHLKFPTTRPAGR